MPRFDPSQAPSLPSADWPEARLAKAKRGYAMEYARTVMQEALALWGDEAGGALLGHAARLVGMQHVHASAAALASRISRASWRRWRGRKGMSPRWRRRAMAASSSRGACCRCSAGSRIRRRRCARRGGLMGGAAAAWDRFSRLERVGRWGGGSWGCAVSATVGRRRALPLSDLSPPKARGLWQPIPGVGWWRGIRGGEEVFGLILRIGRNATPPFRSACGALRQFKVSRGP